MATTPSGSITGWPGTQRLRTRRRRAAECSERMRRFSGARRSLSKASCWFCSGPPLRRSRKPRRPTIPSGEMFFPDQGLDEADRVVGEEGAPEGCAAQGCRTGIGPAVSRPSARPCLPCRRLRLEGSVFASQSGFLTHCSKRRRVSWRPERVRFVCRNAIAYATGRLREQPADLIGQSRLTSF